MSDSALPPGFIPSRHRVDRAKARQLLGALRLLLPEGADPDAARWQAMGEAFMHGDAPMDRLVEWMFAQGMRDSRALFEQALERGIAALPQAPAPLREFFERYERLPQWLDADLLREGGEVFRRGGPDAVYVGRDVALIGGYQAAAFNKTLLLTGALEKGPARRFAETLRWSLDCTGEGGLERYGEGYKSTLRVRLIHAMVRRHVRRLPDWRMEEWGLPINQTDMAATLLGAFNVPLLGARVLGMPQTRRERDAATHLTRYVGWLMGVEEQWLPSDERSALQLLYQFSLSITNPDETSAMMARPMIDEPLGRSYPRFAWLRRRYDRARHLSISRAFLGRQGMRNIGYPDHVLPWYPLLKFPFNLGWHLSSLLLPGGKVRAARAGRHGQERFLAELSGALPAVVGQAAHGFIAGGQARAA
jgi:hypothetical protein